MFLWSSDVGGKSLCLLTTSLWLYLHTQLAGHYRFKMWVMISWKFIFSSVLCRKQMQDYSWAQMELKPPAWNVLTEVLVFTLTPPPFHTLSVALSTSLLSIIFPLSRWRIIKSSKTIQIVLRTFKNVSLEWPVDKTTKQKDPGSPLLVLHCYYIVKHSCVVEIGYIVTGKRCIRQTKYTKHLLPRLIPQWHI